ncbi:MAG: ABC transporter permease subunit, partial [Rhizobacter sp.]
MPEVVVGLSLLLFLVSVQRTLGFPERGMMTIWLGHLLLGMAYATVVIQARLSELNPQLEEAAMDLGARPGQVFFLVTLPMIAQAMVSAWLLTFTLSLDDVVLSAFLSGPGATTMPLVMPEVIIGLSLLLMLVSVQKALGFPERGAMTIWFGHLLLGMAYATVVIQARLQGLNPQLEEAAMDLGAKPFQVFTLVTLPMIAQALMSAWLLTFTLSLDDVVLSAFLNGPGSTTMPLVIFSRARLGLNPSVNAVATVIITLVAIGTVVASYLIARAERDRANAIAQAQRDDG